MLIFYVAHGTLLSLITQVYSCLVGIYDYLSVKIGLLDKRWRKLCLVIFFLCK